MPSPARKPIVYVSSTFVDLEQHRAALEAALEKAQYDVECMEKYPAFDQRPLDKCLADVAWADVYVLLLAHRYGYRPTEGNPDRKSITQMEYDEAGRNPGKPRLVFTVDPDHPWSPKWIDQEEKDKRDLQAFHTEVENRHRRAMFSDPDQLASLVLQALSAREERAASPAAPTYTPADLDAWVERHHQALERAFFANPSVQQRRVHVPLDVRLTPAGAAAPSEPMLLQPDHLEPVLAEGSAHLLLISADGGAGKTSLAFRIARWALAGELGGVRRLPVLIETALADGESVAARLGNWLESQLEGDSGGLDPALVEALLRHKRLIPILDHVSELPEAARQQLVRNLPAGLVIATSRSLDDGYRERPLSRIEPLQIATDRLQSFFLDYLRQQGQGEVLKDDDLVPAQNQLRRIVGDKPITALLAQMFIDDVIAKRRQGLLERRRGLPIGNLTSQFLANFHLDRLDHTMAALPGVGAYLRYVDDMALFADRREDLATARQAIEVELAALRLRLHPSKSQLRRCRDGASFVGFHVLPGRIRVRNHNLRRGRRQLRTLTCGVAAGRISPESARTSTLSWNAHLAHGHTWRLRRRLFADLPFAAGLP